MTHWDVARCFMAGIVLAAFAVAGYILGGIVYLG